MQSKNKRAEILIFIAALLLAGCKQESHHNVAQNNIAPTPSPSVSPSTIAGRIPAHFTALANIKSLAPTLPPEQSTGKVRQPYQVAKEIPQTLTQLPCFCYCDTIGHKSLHSCYENDHSAGCSVCIDSALLAAELKQQGRGDAEIRDQLIAKYNSPHPH